MDFKRARNDEQKKQRINEIFQVALKLYDTNIFQNITMASISKELTFSRGNLYLYFSTKEEIYFAILVHEYEVWLNDVANALNQCSNLSQKDFCIFWSDLLLQHERFMQLYCIHDTILLKNVPTDKLTDYHIKVTNSTKTIIEGMQKCITNISEHQIQLFFDYQLSYLAGFYPKTVRTPEQKNAIAIGINNIKSYNFKTSFSQYLNILLNGILLS